MPVSVVPGTEQETFEQKQAGLNEGEAELVEIIGRKAFLSLRGRWSGWIIAWITGLIIFNIILTILVGLSVLDFSKYQWFITAVTIETFLQIVGMGYIAVRYLFSDKT